ncbi:Serine/threonine-protein phosphatase 4 regulatory subunit 4 [Coelomomyces lativittatus]|nr:Serine/threonine-protein phosphatase 4 regulatory subunit 4 [Coelomomyces lativittatus]KAJ1511282.1 Serine/threonine-protein phosphatase 4 regulatory subunit 4 [Coelomomyces lativittatus]
MLKCAGMCPHLQKSIQNLVSHPSVAVKTKIATCFSVLCELLAPYAYTQLQEPFFKLFESDPCIFQALICRLEIIMKCFLSDSTFRKGTNMDDFLLIIFRKLRILVENSKWQQAENLLSQLSHLADQFSLEHIYELCVPILRKIIQNSLTFPLKQLALQVLIIYARKFRKIEHRESVCRNLVSDLAFSTDFQKRLLFLGICQEVLTTCSFKFFRQYFAHAFLAFSSDAVLSVRRKMASLMPLANKAISVPGVDDAIVKKLSQAREELSMYEIELKLDAATPEELAADQVLIMEEMATIKDDLESRQRIAEKDKKKGSMKSKPKKNVFHQSSTITTGPTILESIRKKKEPSNPTGSNESFHETKPFSEILPYQKSTSQNGLGQASYTSFSHGSISRNPSSSISNNRGSNAEGIDLTLKKEKASSLKISSATKRLTNR